MYAAGVLYNLAFAAPAPGTTAIIADDDAAAAAAAAAAGIKTRSDIAAAGAIQPLVALLACNSDSSSSSGGSSDPRVMHQAVGALWNIAHGHAANKELIVEAGAIKHLVQLLSYGSTSAGAAAAAAAPHSSDGSSLLEDLLHDTAGALATLAEGQPKHQAAIAAAGGIAKLVRLLDLPGSSGSSSSGGMWIHEETCRALAAVADSQSEAVVSAGAIPCLVNLLGGAALNPAPIIPTFAGDDPNPTPSSSVVQVPDYVQLQSLHALLALAKGQPKHQAAIAAQAGAVDQLSLLKQLGGNEAIRQAAASLVQELGTHPGTLSTALTVTR